MTEHEPISPALDIPDVRILSTRLVHEQELIIEVESTLDTVACQRCRRTIAAFDGYEAPRRLHYRPVEGHLAFISFRPKRFRCPYCADHPITLQQIRWSPERNPENE